MENDQPAYMLAARQNSISGWDSSPAVVEALLGRIATLEAQDAAWKQWLAALPA